MAWVRKDIDNSSRSLPIQPSLEGWGRLTHRMERKGESLSFVKGLCSWASGTALLWFLDVAQTLTVSFVSRAENIQPQLTGFTSYTLCTRKRLNLFFSSNLMTLMIEVYWAEVGRCPPPLHQHWQHIKAWQPWGIMQVEENSQQKGWKEFWADNCRIS